MAKKKIKQKEEPDAMGALKGLGGAAAQKKKGKKNAAKSRQLL